METRVKKERGFTSVDITIAMLVIIVFVTVLSSVSYSVYSATTESKRTATALNYAVDIFECIGQIDYSQVDASTISKKLPDLNMTVASNSSSGATGTIGKNYDYTLRVEDYFEDNTIKLITLKITYKISARKTESIELKRIKTQSYI